MHRTYYFERITQQLSYPVQVFATTSPRKILFIINFILAVCSCCISGMAIFLCKLLYDPDFIDIWIVWFGLSVVGLCILAFAIIGMRGAHVVSLDLLLAYFWGIAIFSIPLILALFSTFNYGFYNNIWFKHSWELSNFESVREIFCIPKDTANTKCIVPFYSGSHYNSSSYFNTTLWCIEHYAATDCAQIRDSAIHNAIEWGSKIYIAQNFVGLVELIIIAYSMYTAYQILTGPVITQSMMDNINYLLVFPIVGYAVLASYLWYLRDLAIPQNWLPVLYLALAIIQIFALPLGIISGRLKSRLLLNIYIFIMIWICFAFAAAAGIGWTMSNYVNYKYTPRRHSVAYLACRRGLPGCTDCSSSPQLCPQWSKKEVVTLMALDLRLAGVSTILSILYIIGGLVVAALFDKRLQNYKSDFI